MFIFNFLKKAEVYSFIISALLCILGIILVANPIRAMFFAAETVGAVILLCGIWLAIKYFADNSTIGSYIIVFAFLIIILGIFVICYPAVVISFITSIIGIVILIRAFIEIKNAVDARKLGYEHWPVLMGSGVVKSILGFIILFVPFFATEWILRIVGLVIIMETVSHFITVYKFSKDIENLKSESVGDIIDI